MSEYSCNEHGHDFHENCAACGAADDWASMEKRIAELETELAALREALQEIADSDHLGNGWARLKARAALKERADETP